MTDLSGLRNWLFKGMAIESRLDELEAEGLHVRAATQSGALQRVLPLEDFAPSIRKSAMDSLPAFLAFFCLENSVRAIVVDRLNENFGNNWWEEHAPKALRDKVDQRREKEGKNRWHVQRGASPIFYVDFGDLLLLVQNNWSCFEDLFPDQHWVANRLNDLEASRNIIAHSNELDQRELDRIRMYLQDWVKQVG